MIASKSYQDFEKKIAQFFYRSELQNSLTKDLNKPSFNDNNLPMSFMVPSLNIDNNTLIHSSMLIGILFTHHNSTLGKEIFAQIDMFNARSGEWINFYFPGYDDTHKSKTIKMEEIDNKTWSYDADSFDEFASYLESITTWEHSGDTDLLLCTVSKYGKKLSFDWETAIVCHLDKMLFDEAIFSLPSFFQKIIKYAKDHHGKTHSGYLSDTFSKTNFLKDAIESLIPENLLKKWKKYSPFVIKNIGR